MKEHFQKYTKVETIETTTKKKEKEPSYYKKSLNKKNLYKYHH